MKEVLTRCDSSGRGQLLITNGANILKLKKLLWSCFGERVDLPNRLAAKVKLFPAVLADLEDVEVCMNAHHGGPYDAARFKNQNPQAVDEEEYPREEFKGAANCFDVVDVIVQTLPLALTEGIIHK